MTDDIRLQSLLRGSLDPHWRRGVKGKDNGKADAALAALAHDGLLNIARDNLEARDALRRSTEYTAVGKAKQAARVAEISKSRLEKERWAGVIDRFRKARAELRKTAGSEPTITDQAARMIAYSAVWSMLGNHGAGGEGDAVGSRATASAADPLGVEMMARKALEAGDMLSFEALCALPSLHPGAMTPETIEALETERLESTNPKAAGEVAELNALTGDLERLLEDVEGLLDAPLAGHEQPASKPAEDDPLAEMAFAPTAASEEVIPENRDDAA